eukprot:6194720-Pleurochrysis_carterae.AAC.6
MAEKSLTCISCVLVRHTQQFRSWPDTLPLVVFALICTKHLSTAVSPFFALYGRDHLSLPELESPSLVEVTEIGNEFVDTLATRLRQAWLAARDTSESLRRDAAARSDARHRRWLKPNIMDSVGGIQVGDRVLLRHGSVEYAALLKKHGFPPPPLFRVLEVIPKYNALRVDTRGTGIQPIFKATACKRAPDDWWYAIIHHPPASGRFDRPATTLAAARGNPYEVGAQINQPDLTQGEPNVFLVNQLLEARRERKVNGNMLRCGLATTRQALSLKKIFLGVMPTSMVCSRWLWRATPKRCAVQLTILVNATLEYVPLQLTFPSCLRIKSSAIALQSADRRLRA